MTGGDIAALIAAVAFVALVVALIVPIVKLGRLLDETRQSMREVTQGVLPLLTESTEAVTEANRQLDKVDDITTSVSKVTDRVSGVVENVTSVIDSPIARVAGVLGAFGRGRRRRRGLGRK
jgi:uncharacterized protein YoxC